MSDIKQVDVLIAGQGAAAFAAGLYSSRYQVDTLIAGEQFGGETAIGGTIENYPGQPDIDGFDLMMKFKEQVDNLETPTAYSNVKSVTKNGDVFRAVLEVVFAGPPGDRSGSPLRHARLHALALRADVTG